MKLFSCSLIISLLTGTPSFAEDAPVSKTDSLPEIVVETDNSRRFAAIRNDGAVVMHAKSASSQPSFMGSGDAAGMLKALPFVTTSSELQAALCVRGGNGGDNLFVADGVRIVNPMHILGFYSAFNPAFYRSYTFRASRIPAVTANAAGAYFEASGASEIPPHLTGNLSAGLIESHGAINIPLGKSAIAAGARHSYLGLLFPDILKMDKTVIKYGFTDINGSWLWQPDINNTLNATIFYSRDRMSLDNDKAGRKEGVFGWQNLASGIVWKHGDLNTSLTLSNYRNTFDFSEGGRELSLPSSMTQLTAEAKIPFRDFNFEADLNYRHCSGQRNNADTGKHPETAAAAFEYSIAADWRHIVSHWLQIDAGLRISAYHCGSYNTAVPMPRLTISRRFDRFSLFASYNRLTQFEHLVEETTASFPADFRINSTSAVKPRDTHSVEVGIHGFFEPLGIGFLAEAYWNRLLNVVEFDGSLIDLANPGFIPSEHLTSGNGFSTGLSLTLTRSFGRLRGQIGYNLGFARLKNSRYGTGYYNAPHDRRHDLTIILSFDIIKNLTAAASFTHATGAHYTRAKYGYMIDENLICEYFPHNSSRLPDYNRLDFSLNWQFRSSTRLTHILNLSIYNAAATRNVLFIYTSYSVDKGIQNLESIMKSVIPSISYAIEF